MHAQDTSDDGYMTDIKKSFCCHLLMKSHKRTLMICVLTIFLFILVLYGYSETVMSSSADMQDLPRQLFQDNKDIGRDNLDQPNANTSVILPDLELFAKQQHASIVKKIRIMCLILTMEKDARTKMAAVNNTWAVRCDKHFYIISSKHRRHDFINVNISDTRFDLIHKIEFAFNYIYDNYIDEFDFLLKADDDTYVVVENLKYLVSNYDRNKPGYLGFHFNKFVKNGYMSGGAGYVLSNRALRDLVENGYRSGKCVVRKSKDDPENSEDINTGRCLQTVGVPILSSLDREGRETFHPYTFHGHFFGNLPGYLYSWAKNPVEKGERCCGRYVISFHYMTPNDILFIDHLLYKTTVFGLQDSGQHSEQMFQVKDIS